jgi:hypothetical protein
LLQTILLEQRLGPLTRTSELGNNAVVLMDALIASIKAVAVKRSIPVNAVI